jgi:TonB-dependent starch-binding outer membrane protein SusC
MKKKFDSWVPLNPPLKKLIMELKLAILVIVVSVSNVFASNSYSQVAKVSLDMKNTSLEQVMDEIESQSEFYFIFNQKQIDVNRVVDIQVDNKLITDILPGLFNGTNINYAVLDRKILLTTDPLDNSILPVASGTELQQKQITGTITDKDGNPLAGVNVVVTGTTTGTMSDIAGKYNIEVAQGAKSLTFTFIGMEPQVISIGTMTQINLTMAESSIGLDEVVVIGYGTMKKSDLTGSVQRADLKLFKDQPNTSIIQSLQGTVPGLNVGAVTAAGQDPSVSIRGKISFSGSSSPLVVVDGVVYHGSYVELNQNDIESIDILKDASSKAIYGSQAANGVILITSKKGKKEAKPVFNFSSYYAIQTPSSILHPLDRQGFIDHIGWVEYDNAYLAPDYTQPNSAFNPTNYMTYGPETLEGFNNGTNVDWLDLATQNGSLSNNNVSMTGSTGKTSYFLSAGYTKQKGYLKNDEYGKINIRANFDNDVTKWLNIGMQTFLTSGDYSGAAANLSYANLVNPLDAAYNEDGSLRTYVLGGITNPLLNLKIDDFDKRLNLFGNFTANFTIPFVKGLSYKINYSTNYRNQRQYQFNPYGANETGSSYKYNDYSQDQSLDNIVTYKRLFGEKHDLNVTMVYGYEQRDGENTLASGAMFVNKVLGYNGLEYGDVNSRSVESGAWNENSLYQMGRLNYKYNDRYIATLTIRRDGFSGFGTNKKFGTFPSAALGWVMSKEQFIANALPWVSNLKLRVSYGSSGNRTVQRYATLAKVQSDFVYEFGDGGSSAYGQSIYSMANNNLGWETTKGSNVGLDFGLFKNRLSASIDYYNTNTSDVIFDMNIPNITGFSTITTNIGSIDNSGIEGSISGVIIQKSDFTWTATVNFSKNNNKIVSILGVDANKDGKEDDLVANSLFIGQALGTIYNYNVEGMYQIGDALPSGYHAGNYMIEDLNSDGKITSESDRKILGTSNPLYRFSISNSFNYKNWGLTFFINSIQGGKNDYMADNNPVHGGGGWWNSSNIRVVNVPKEFDYWYPANAGAKFGNAKYDDPINPNLYRSRSFIRLQDVNLTYKVPVKLLNNAVDELSIFFSGKNLLTLTNWIGVDPETGAGFNIGASPVMKSYSFGLNLTF